MKKSFFILFAGFALTVSGFSNLIENGDFSSGVEHWGIQRNPDYGVKTTAEVKKGEGLVLKGLREAKGGYMGIIQAVKVEEGRKYKLSFEVKSSSPKGYSVTLGDWSADLISSKHHNFSSASWHKVECVLQAKGSSDSKWYKAWHSAYRKSKLVDGKTRFEKIKDPKDRKQNPGNVLRFGIGLVSGEFGIRNVVMEEVK